MAVTISGDAATTRTSLGLGSVATLDTGQVPGQIVNTFQSQWTQSTNGTSTSYVYTGMSMSPTLESANNKLIMFICGGMVYVNDNSNTGVATTVCQQSSTTYDSNNDLAGGTEGIGFFFNRTDLAASSLSLNYLISNPGTTTPVFRLFARSRGSTTWYLSEGTNTIVWNILEIKS